MDRQVKNNGKTIWIVLTCILTITVFVLVAGLYHFRQLTLTLESQLAETEEKNTNLSVEVVKHREETAAAKNEVRTIRVMNGILQQQDGNDEWIDVAPVEELESEDPILLGRNKMQELIDKNREAVQDGTVDASEVSPLIEGKRTESEDTLVSSSTVQSVTEKTTTRTSKQGNNAASATTTPKTTAPAATEPAATQPTEGTGNTSGGSSDSGSSYTAPSDRSSSGGSSTDSGSSSGGSSDGGSSDSGSGGSPDSGSSDSGSSDSGSSESGDGEDIGWTDDIL